MCAALTAGCATQAEPSVGQNAGGRAARSFSFAVYGDSRSMMYLPYKADQEPQARQLMVDMFELVLPTHVAEAVVKKDVKLTYDPATNELVQMVMPFDTASEVTLKVDKGWVTEASVEDKKLLPGVERTMFRLEGGEWVAREVVKDIQRGRAKFIVNTGDLVWWGKQGTNRRTIRTGSWSAKTCSDSCRLRTESCRMPGCLDACSPPSAIMKCGMTPTSKACLQRSLI